MKNRRENWDNHKNRRQIISGQTRNKSAFGTKTFIQIAAEASQKWRRRSFPSSIGGFIENKVKMETTSSLCDKYRRKTGLNEYRIKPHFLLLKRL